MLLAEQQRARGRAAETVQPQRSIRLDDLAVRAHPVRLTAAAGEMPLAADLIAARDGPRLILIGRPPGDIVTRIRVDRPGGFQWNERGDKGRAVGDEQIPANRAVMAADLLDRAKIRPRLNLIAANRKRQQHACQPSLMDSGQNRFRNGLGALDLVGRSRDCRPRSRARADGSSRDWSLSP